MIALLFIALALIALTHFLIEGIIAPSCRFKLRLGLFEIRDELRTLKLQRGDEIDDEVFDELQDSINFSVSRLSQIDLRLLRNTRKALENDPQLRKRLARRMAALEACPVQEIRQIRDRYCELLDYALAVNSAGWFPYIVPIALSFAFAGKAKELLKKAFLLPENDLYKVFPHDSVIATT